MYFLKIKLILAAYFFHACLRLPVEEILYSHKSTPNSFKNILFDIPEICINKGKTFVYPFSIIFTLKNNRKISIKKRI